MVWNTRWKKLAIPHLGELSRKWVLWWYCNDHSCVGTQKRFMYLRDCWSCSPFCAPLCEYPELQLATGTQNSHVEARRRHCKPLESSCSPPDMFKVSLGPHSTTIVAVLSGPPFVASIPSLLLSFQTPQRTLGISSLVYYIKGSLHLLLYTWASTMWPCLWQISLVVLTPGNHTMLC